MHLIDGRNERNLVTWVQETWMEWVGDAKINGPNDLRQFWYISVNVCMHTCDIFIYVYMHGFIYMCFDSLFFPFKFQLCI
jgi:hypothetical protein